MSVRQGVNTIAGSGYTKSEVDTLLAGKADTATTLAGYGITDGADTNLSNITATGKEVIAHNAMPSTRYIDLTLGASGSNYTAPADGYFSVGGYNANNYNGSVAIRTGNLRTISNGSIGEYGCSVIFPVKKGQTVNIDYTNITDWLIRRFVYANGAQ